MDSLYLVREEVADGEHRSVPFEAHESGQFTLLLKLPPGTCKFQISPSAKPTAKAFGGKEAMELGQQVKLHPGGEPLSLSITEAGIYLFQAEVREDDQELRLSARLRFQLDADAAEEDASEVPLGHFLDMELPVFFEIAQGSIELGEAADIRIGSTVMLDSPVGDLVNVIVAGKLVAKGQLVVEYGQVSVFILEILPVK